MFVSLVVVCCRKDLLMANRFGLKDATLSFARILKWMDIESCNAD